MSADIGLFDESSASPVQSKQFSPIRLLTFLVLTIFLAEVVAMGVLYFLNFSNYVVETVLDGLIMLALIIPALYLFYLKPLLNQVEERTRAEISARASEKLLKKVLELMPVGVWIVDKNGDVVHGNPESKNIWGDLRLVGIQDYREYKAWWADSGKRIEPNEWAAARAITRRETSINEEINIEAFDGFQKTILNSALPILDENDNLQGAVVVNQDITQRRQMEKKIIQTNQILEKFFQSINTLLAYMDRDFNFIRVNESYAKADGRPVEFFIGKNHFDLYPHAENEAIFRRVVETGEPYTVYEKPFEYPENPERGVTYWDWNVLPVKDTHQCVEGLVFSLIEVTERKRAELKLEKQNQDLRALSEAEHRQREMAEGLMQSVVALNSSLHLEQVLNTVLDQIRRVVPFQGATIALIEGNTFRVAGFCGFEGYPVNIDTQRINSLGVFPLFQRICDSFQSILVPDTTQEADWRAAPGMEWMRSFLAAPLTSEGRVTGVLTLISDQQGYFTLETAERLMSFAAPAALALHNAQLYKAELTARQVAEMLTRATLELTQTLDLDQVVASLLDHIDSIIHPDITGIALLEGQTRLAPRAVRSAIPSLDADLVQSMDIDLDTNPLLKRLVSSYKSILISDTKDDLNWVARPGLEAVRTWMGIPLVAGFKVIGVVGMAKMEPNFFTKEHVQWAEALVGQAAMAIQNAWLFEQVRASSERLHGLSRRLVEVQESERRYIASELHDEVGQALTSLMVGLQLIESRAEQPEAVRAEVSEMGQVLNTVLENLHRLAVDLRPVSLDYLGLEAALQQHVEMMSEKLGLEIQFAMTGISERLPANIEIAFYRIVQEAINNVARHAKARHVDVLITQRDDCLVMMIEDDGIGFIPEKASKGKRIGLEGMRERAEMLDGKLLVESLPGKGTTILVEVPYANQNSNRR